MWKYIFVICPDNSYYYQKAVKYGVFVDNNGIIININGCDGLNGSAICNHCLTHYINKLIGKPIPIPNDASHPVRF